MSIPDAYKRGDVKPNDLTKKTVYDYDLIGTVIKDEIVVFGHKAPLVIADEDNEEYYGFADDTKLYQYGSHPECGINIVCWAKRALCPRCGASVGCT